MTAIVKNRFPIRLPNALIPGIHASLDAAFAAQDHIYVARFGTDRPELRGCSLILIGNRLGGEKVLDRHGIHTAFACLYRAYGAWRDGHDDEARRWVAEGLALGGEDERLGRLSRLMDRHAFRLVFHTDFARSDRLDGFRAIPGVEMVLTSHLIGGPDHSLPFGRSIATAVPPGAPIDLVLVDDFKMVPVGLRDLGAPVVVNPHDHEWYYEMLEEVMPEVDLVTIGSSWETVELSRAFGVPATIASYPFSLRIPKVTGLKDIFLAKPDRAHDLVFTGGITHDFYRDKRQRIVSLAKLDRCFSVRLLDAYLDDAGYDSLMRDTRFTINSVRASNSLNTRPFESLAHGALHLVEEENGFPHIFSEMFHCFPTYGQADPVGDVERHLRGYGELIEKFLPQAGLLEQELTDLLPDDEHRRAMRFMRHLLYMTQVEMGGICKAQGPAPEATRTWVPCNEPWLLRSRPDQVERLREQTASPHWVRRSIADIDIPGGNWMTPVWETVSRGMEEFPDSLGLAYTRALCVRWGGFPDQADILFEQVASGHMKLRRNESFPRQLDQVNGYYWITDARIRQRCPELEQIVPEETVWRSYALNQRADLAILKGLTLAGDEAVVQYAKAAALLERSLAMFSINENAQRLYLRALFGMANNGVPEWAEPFLAAFRAALHNDYTVLHDFAPMAVHLLLVGQRPAEAQAVIDELNNYLSRTLVTGYPCAEAILLARHYGLGVRGSEAPQAAA